LISYEEVKSLNS
jgi:hypothetical protein